MSPSGFFFLLISAMSCCAASQSENDRCPKPEPIKGAQLQGEWNDETYSPGKVAHFSCLQGFTQDGPIKMACIEGTWFPMAKGQCKKESSIKEYVEKMAMPKIDFEVKDSLKYPFIEVERNVAVTSLKNEFTSCKNPPIIENGDITESSKQESYVTDDVVTFICNPGYHLTGPDQSTCLNGRWTALPMCTATSCRTPPLVLNSRFSEKLKTSYASGDKVTYECNAGYTFERFMKGEAQCENTKWINVPVCRQIGAQCGPPPVVQFGDTISFGKNSYKSGEFVQYKCPDFYILNGSSIVMCMNGVWDKAPVCLEPCTAKEKDMDIYNIHLRWSQYRKLYSPHGDFIEFQCESGYEAPPGTAMRIPCLQGKLDYPKCFKRGFCVLDQSAMIINNIHYNVNSIVDDGQTVTFQCNEGMVAENNLEAKCEQKKINYPKCVAAKSCETPIIRNGFLKGERQASYESGSYVEFECNKDYVMNGPINAKCENGQWIELPVCLRPCRISTTELSKYNIQLLPSDDPENILDSVHLHGTELGVTCMPGFRRPNPAYLVIECYDGRFRYRKCFSGKTCRIDQDELDSNYLELDEIHNSDVFYEENESVYFKCKTGYYSKTTSLVGRCSGKLSYPRCADQFSV